ncbi:MAG: RNA polymerase sigma factor [Saprospiraceae bacterium]|nr:RNA polymerase sigma factor [Saprospiraceae bacterium]
MSVCKEKTYQELYYKYGEYLRNFLYYKSGDMVLSEDLCHDSFIKLWENCSKVTIDKAKSYLFTVANNMFLNKAKKDKVILKFGNTIRSKVDKNDPHFILQKSEFKQRLELAISELPETQREVFLMNRIDKKKYKEISEELGISVKAVEKRMHKALSALRKIHTGV